MRGAASENSAPQAPEKGGQDSHRDRSCLRKDLPPPLPGKAEAHAAGSPAPTGGPDGAQRRGVWALSVVCYGAWGTSAREDGTGRRTCCAGLAWVCRLPLLLHLGSSSESQVMALCLFGSKLVQNFAPQAAGVTLHPLSGSSLVQKVRGVCGALG